MSSRFSRRPRVTQPPPVCKGPPPPGPFDPTYPPQRALVAATWIGPTDCTSPSVITSIQNTLWDPHLLNYQTDFTVAPATLTALVQISNLPPWTAYIELIVSDHPEGTFTGEATIAPLPDEGPLHITNPPLIPSHPGHTFILCLSAYPRPG